MDSNNDINSDGNSNKRRFDDVIRIGAARQLDFVTVEELRKRTSVSPNFFHVFALNELLCNSLDKDATMICITMRAEGNLFILEVGDNGSRKLTLEEIEIILNFDFMASSKRGILRVSRGYLGNALKCVIGYAYALAESKGIDPLPVIVRSDGFLHMIFLKPDRVRGVIDHDIETIESVDDGLTVFTVSFPKGSENNYFSELYDIVFATAMVNPTRQVSYDIFGKTGALGSPKKGVNIRQETSVLWYAQKQFGSLFEDFVRAVPEAPLKEFISMFRGFSSKKIIREILQKLGSGDHDSKGNQRLQFLPATPLKDLTKENVSQLFILMKNRAKPISKRSIPAVLGCVGEEVFEKVREKNGWKKLRYIMMTGINLESRGRTIFESSPSDEEEVDYPYLIELAIFDRNNDNEGLKVYQCVNFMASREEIFSYIYDVKVHLAKVGIRAETPVTVVVHLICPVLKWLNYGKSALDD